MEELRFCGLSQSRWDRSVSRKWIHGLNLSASPQSHYEKRLNIIVKYQSSDFKYQSSDFKYLGCSKARLDSLYQFVSLNLYMMYIYCIFVRTNLVAVYQYFVVLLASLFDSWIISSPGLQQILFSAKRPIESVYQNSWWAFYISKSCYSNVRWRKHALRRSQSWWEDPCVNLRLICAECRFPRCKVHDWTVFANRTWT